MPTAKLTVENAEPSILFELADKEEVSSGETYARDDGVEFRYRPRGVERRGVGAELPSFEIVLRWSAEVGLDTVAQILAGALLGKAKEVVVAGYRRHIEDEDDVMDVLREAQSGE